MAARKNLRIDQGSDFKHRFRYLERDGVTPIPLINYSARGQVRPYVESDEILHEATTDNGYLVIDEAAGYVDFLVPGEISSQWWTDEAVYDIELLDPLGRPVRLVQGDIYLDRETTRSPDA